MPSWHFYLPYDSAKRPHLKLVSVVNLYTPFNVDSKARYVSVVNQRNVDIMKYVETPTVKLNQNRVLSKSSLAAYGIQRNEAKRNKTKRNLLHMQELTSINGTENYSLPWKLSSPDRLFRKILMAVDW